MGSAGAAFGAPPQAGVLLLGGSGAGKSDLALRLIAEGAHLVADDRVELFVFRNRLYARAPRRLAGLMEARGIGIFEIPYSGKVRIALAVELVEKLSRLPEHRVYAVPGLNIQKRAKPPLVRICPEEQSAPAKISAAVGAFEHKRFREAVTPP
jgi:serine kinase of HPr protein (carbohydrate metabolism regulator)